MYWLIVAAVAVAAIAASAGLGILVGKVICYANEREGTR